jgi:phosphonate transport system substrate-binding protein
MAPSPDGEQAVSTPEPTPGVRARTKTSHPVRDLLLILLPLLLVIGGVAAYLYYGVYSAVGKVNFPGALRGVVNPDQLDESFSADGDNLVAACPRDPKEQVDPKVLKLGVLEPLEQGKKVWKEFAAHLATKTGKKVEIVHASAAAGATAQEIKDGNLHIAAASTGAVPVLVNTAGFVPFAVLADDKGNFGYQMEVLVRSDSPIKKLADLKGRTITLTSLSSLSSARAPLMLLWQKEKMLPGRDYQIQFVTGQVDAIKGILHGQYEVVAVANDLLRRVEAEERARAEKEGEEIAEEPYRSIHKSDTYPPFCFGHVHNLKPELAAKVREAFLDPSFPFAGTGLESYKKANQTRFVAVTYKKDWEGVRAVDRAILELVEQNP